METLQQVLDWAKANPWVTTAIVVYVIANFAPRPDPSKMKGWQRALWLIVDRLCVLTHDRLPGSLKMLLLDTPVPEAKPKPKKAKAKAKAKAKDDPPAEDEADEPEDDKPSEEEVEPDSDEDEEKGAPP